ncbi:MAG TPA: hypothetical protein VMM36_01775 [Opitutaceae bacterium]|nr:hypothetical protein [Opitutaceae bacterium]
MTGNLVTIALLPFENLSANPEDARLATGFLHDLLSEMSRFPSLGVISADSVTAVGALDGGDAALAARVGAKYLLNGTLRRWEDSLRFNVRLIEAASARQLWAGRFDSADLPAAHDEIAAKVTNALALQVDASLLASARRRPPASLETYECWLRGMECLQRGTAESDEEGRRYFEQALKLDPHYARAHAGISLSHFNEWSCQAWEGWESSEKACYDHAMRAEALDPDDAVCQVILARIEQYRREFDRAAARLEHAHALAPNNADILKQLSLCHTFDGDAARGMQFFERALELNPFPTASVHYYGTVILFALRRYEEALERANKAPPGAIVDTPAYEAAASALLGNTKEAARHLAEFREDFAKRIVKERQPSRGELLTWTLHVNPFRREEDTAHLAEGLRLAGLEGDYERTSALVDWPVANAFRREGALWMLAYDHHVAQMPELRGFHDIAKLLAAPGQEIHSAELAGLAVKSAGIEVLDEKARRTYRKRLAELEEEITAAAEADQIARAKKLEEERDALIAELRKSSGLGGRLRKTGASDERARTAVTWRIRNAVKKIGEVHPPLSRHLANSIQTGTFCCYQPEQPTAWQL